MHGEERCGGRVKSEHPRPCPRRHRVRTRSGMPVRASGVLLPPRARMKHWVLTSVSADDAISRLRRHYLARE